MGLMATKHVCDRCGAEVGSRSDLWVLSIARAERPMFGEYRMESWELCGRCKRHLYVEVCEGDDRLERSGKIMRSRIMEDE